MKKTPTPKSGNANAHKVRIIGGQWKRTPLPVPDALGLRPTPDRVRETVFNWLNHLFDGHWEDIASLDLFAGSGALGFEAASRGAARVTLVENHPATARQLQANAEKLRASNVNVVRGDALAVMQKMSAASVPGLRLIFADPPYHQDWLPKILPLCQGLLAKDGFLYVEAETPLNKDNAPAWFNGWEVIRAGKAGMVHFHLLQRKSVPKIEA